MPPKKNIFPAFFFLLLQSAYGQFYNLPSEFNFSQLTQKQLAAADSSLHTSVQPYIPFFSDKYRHVSDSHRVFKYVKDDPGVNVIFYDHLIHAGSKKKNFSITLDPLLNLQAGRDFADSLRAGAYTNTRGFIGSGTIGDRFYFETLLAENQSVFPGYIADQTRISKVVPGQGGWKTFKKTGYDYAFSSGFFSVQLFKNVNLQAGHGKQKIGHGYRSLLLSDNAFNYPYVRLSQQWFKGRVQYTNIYASLMNLVQASKVISANTERLYQKKSAAFQYLSVNLSKRINVSFFQGLIWRAGDDKNRQHLGWQFFNPLIYSNLFTYGLNHRNNIVAGADLKIRLLKTLNVYGQLMADRVYAGATDNLWGYQAGINYYDVFGIKNLSFQCELNRVAENSYSSPVNETSQAYFHYNQHLAYTPGAGNELLLFADYRYKRFFLNIRTGFRERQFEDNNKAMDQHVTNVNGSLGYLINPSYNLNISAGVNYRKQNFRYFTSLNNETNYIYLALRTSIYNLYYDF